MLGRVFLITLGSIWWLGRIYKGRQYVKKRADEDSWISALPVDLLAHEDRISALPDDLLFRIFSFVPTKDVVATMILSKQWRDVWTMVPQLVYKEMDDESEQQQSIWCFLDKSLQLHKAPILDILVIEVGPHCPVDVDVGKWISNAVDRKVRVLWFDLTWSGEPTSLPKSFYICDTLVFLHLCNKVFVDVSSPVCLPSLENLYLISVVYKDEDSLVRLLSGCPILKRLHVIRHDQDNVRHFSVKVPSLQSLAYVYVDLSQEHIGGTLVIDSAVLKKFYITDHCSTNFCSIENKPCLDEAVIRVYFYPYEKFLKSLSSVTHLELDLTAAMAACCDVIKFYQLIDCKISPLELDWFQPFMSLLQNCPKLKVLLIDQTFFQIEDFSLSWKQPSSVPVCLSTNLEIFEWKEYGGTTEEKELVRYIFANSKCLKRAGISFKSTTCPKDGEKMRKELKSMTRISTSSQLLFSTQLEVMPYVKNDY